MNQLSAHPNSKYLFAVVEDDSEFRSFLSDFFHFRGFRVESFSDPVHFFDHCEERLPTFTAVVSDINMPRMNGFELLQKIKIKYSELPIILVSAGPDLGIAKKAKLLGANCFLSKPFPIKEIQNSVEHIIQSTYAIH